MASLKSYISSLLSSYRGSHKSVPSSQCISFDYVVSARGEAEFYTAPTDGFLVAEVLERAQTTVVLLQQFGDFIASDTTAGDVRPVASMPIRKGVGARYFVDGPCTLHCMFYPCVGS